MHVLMVHNYYQTWGGEDSSVEVDLQLLRRFGHTVSLYTRHNDEIQAYSLPQKASLISATTWSSQSYRAIRRQIERRRPDVVHFQNFFPLISPAAYYACREAGIPVVQTLHNYRLLCPMSMLVRDGQICEACVTGSLWNSIRYRCYRDSRTQTAAVAFMLAAHRALGSWKKQVTLFTTPSEFARQKFIQAGLPAEKIIVRPHYLMDFSTEEPVQRSGALYVGRLSPEKGLGVLLEAWRELPDIPLRILGNGSLLSWLEKKIQEEGLAQVKLGGFIPYEKILQEYRKAALVVLPSMVYETFGRTILEAYAAHTPVIASRIGAYPDLVKDQQTGRLTPPGDAAALRQAVRQAYRDPSTLDRWGENGYRLLVDRYSPEPAHELLMQIYQMAVHSKNETG